MNREERRKKKVTKVEPPPEHLTLDQQVMAWMITNLVEYFQESMREAGLTEKQIDDVNAGVAAKQRMDLATGNVVGMPDPKFMQ